MPSKEELRQASSKIAKAYKNKRGMGADWDDRVKYFMGLYSDPSLSVDRVGKKVRDKFPGFWKNSTSDKSVYTTCKFAAINRGLIASGAVGKRSTEQRSAVKEPNTDWLTKTPELVIPFKEKLVVVSDPHFPEHDADMFSWLKDFCTKNDITTIIWNGDVFDNSYIGHMGKQYHDASTFTEGLEATASAMNMLAESGIEEQYQMMGNHCDKMFRMTQGEITFQEFLDIKLRPLLTPDVNLRATNRYYIVMEPREKAGWPFNNPAQFPWYFTHQKNYSKVPGSVAMELASIELGNMVCGHQHHLTVTKHKSGKMWCCDGGTFQHVRLPRYKNERQSRHPKWANGFISIINGTPQVHSWEG